MAFLSTNSKLNKDFLSHELTRPLRNFLICCKNAKSPVIPGRFSSTSVSGASLASFQLPAPDSGLFSFRETSPPPVPGFRRVRVLPDLRRRLPELAQPGSVGVDVAQSRPLDPQDSERAGQPDHPEPREVQHLEHGVEIAPSRPQAQVPIDGTLHRPGQGSGGHTDR